MRGGVVGVVILALAACGGVDLAGTLRLGSHDDPSDGGRSSEGDARATTSLDGGSIAPVRDAGNTTGPDGAAMEPDAAPRCGDGVCGASEACMDCAVDCGACGWPEALARSEEAVLARVNQLRASGATCGGRAMPPAPPLAMSLELRQAARLHSADMGAQDYFDHTSLDGRNFSQRAAEAGYQGFASAENIAAGSDDADGAFGQWSSSSGHCRNIMSVGATEIGIGHAYDSRGRYGHYWTQVFGAR